MRKVIVNDEMKIILGRLGENNALMVMFPVEDMIASFGQGTFMVMAQRNIDDAPYPVATTNDGRYVYWSTSNSDLSSVGEGKVQLTMMVGGSIVKTKIWKTLCLPSLDESPEVPEPYESWVNQIIEASGSVQTYAEQAGNNADRAEEAYRNTKAIDDEVEEHIEVVEGLLEKAIETDKEIEEHLENVEKLVSGFDTKVASAITIVETTTTEGLNSIETKTTEGVSSVDSAKTSAITEINRAKEGIGESVRQAKASEDNAKASEESASASATTATTKASEASASATEASRQVDLAKAEVTKAEGEVEKAKAEVSNAQGYANEAKGYRDELSGTIATVNQHSEEIVELQGLSLSVVNGCLNITYEGV